MNKFKLFLIAAAIVITSNAAMAQAKVGYINIDQVLSIMPEAGKIDSIMNRYQQDSIYSELVNRYDEARYHDSILSKTDTTKLKPAVLKMHKENLERISMEINNWQSYAQQMYQAKQGQLLQPVYGKIMTTIRAVAKEKGYAYVYDKSVFVVAPDADDLLPAVAQRLKLTVPQNMAGIRSF